MISRTRFYTLLVSAVLMLLMSIGGVTTAQQSDDDYTISDDLQAQLNTIESTTTEIRNLDQLDDVTLRFPTREELSDFLRTTLANELSDDIVANELDFYVAFGFLPQGYDLRDNLLALYEDQVAGYYDPETDEMNVILFTGERPGDRLPFLEQVIYAHEYVHALQDQHFDLTALLEDVDEENVDALLARQALVEGDATSVQNIYTERAAEANPLGTLVETISGGLQAGNLTLPENLPPILGAELLWSYLRGAEFVDAIYEAEGSWDAVNDVYANPPVSTEQIYHPQRYLDGDTPLTVELGEDNLGESWSMVREGTLGEFYLRQYLGQQLTRETVSTAGTGWGGDRYMIYENSANNSFAWELALAWDTAADATEFQDAIVTYAENAGQTEVINITESATCYADDAGSTLCVDTAGDSDTRVTLAATPQLAQMLLNATSTE